MKRTSGYRREITYALCQAEREWRMCAGCSGWSEAKVVSERHAVPVATRLDLAKKIVFIGLQGCHSTTRRYRVQGESGLQNSLEAIATIRARVGSRVLANVRLLNEP